VTHISDPPIHEELSADTLRSFLTRWEDILRDVSSDWANVDLLTKYQSLVMKGFGSSVSDVFLHKSLAIFQDAADIQGVVESSDPRTLSRYLVLLLMTDWQPGIVDGLYPALISINCKPGDEIAEIWGSECLLTVRRVDKFHELIGPSFVGECSEIPFPCVQSSPWQQSDSILDSYFHLGLNGRWRGMAAPGWVEIAHDQPDPPLSNGWVGYETRQDGIEKIYQTWCYHTETLQRISALPVAYGDEYNPAEDSDPIPPGWRFVNPPSSFCTHDGTGAWLLEDPRYTDNGLGPVPDGWTLQKTVYQSKDENEAQRPFTFELAFVNVATGELTRDDPCLAENVDTTRFRGLRII
jgi:hypothetical protein